MSDYDDNLLESLRRQYSKDETVAALSKRITELEEENIFLMIDKTNLTAELDTIVKNMDIITKAKVKARKEDLYNIQLGINKDQAKTIKELTKVRDRLLSEKPLINKGDKVLAWDDHEENAKQVIFLADVGLDIYGYKYICIDPAYFEEYENGEPYNTEPFKNIKKL